MDPIRRIIRQAQRRMVLQAGLSVLGWLALAGLGLSTVYLLIDRLLAIPIPAAVYLFTALAAVLGAPLVALTRRPSDLAAASAIDQRLALKDRLATSLYAATVPDQPFAQEVISEARQATAGVRVSAALPLKLVRVWNYVPPLAIVLALLAWLLPAADLLGLASARAQSQAQQARQDAAREEIVKAVATLEKTPPATQPSPLQDPLQTLKQMTELTQEELRSPAAQREAAAKLSQAQEQLAQDVRQREQEMSQLKNAMSRLDPKKSGPADDLAKALRRGDFQAAQRETDNLASRMENMTPQEKQTTAEQLSNMSRQLDEASRQQAQQQAKAEQAAKQALQDAGVPQEKAQKLQEQNFNPQAVEKALQEQGASPQQAQQTAKQIQQQQSQRQAAGQNQQRTGNLSKSMDQLSKAASEQSTGQTSPQPSAWQTSRQIGEMARSQRELDQKRQSQSQVEKAMQSMCESGNASSGQGQGAGQSQAPKPGTGGNQPGDRSAAGQTGQPSTAAGAGQRPGQSGSPGPRPGGNSSGTGGSKPGTGAGGALLGQEQKLTGYQTDQQLAPSSPEGRTLASWMTEGEIDKGQAQVEFDQAVTQAQQTAERAVTEQRVPQRYHRAIQDYFDQLPKSQAPNHKQEN